MGQFIVRVDAVGGHGCERQVKDGETVEGCGRANCVDCITRDYVSKLRAVGTSFTEASLTHWPGLPSEVKDDLLTGVRHGSFG